MVAKKWSLGTPPKSKDKPIKLRYEDPWERKHQGNFIWSDEENTWVECVDGPDGVALYEDDGYKITGWKE